MEMNNLSELPRNFVANVKTSATFRTKVIILCVLGVLFTIFGFALFIKTVVSFSYPKYAFEFVSADPFALQEAMPQFTLCPGYANYSSQSHELVPGVIDKVECWFHEIISNDPEDPSKGSKTTRTDIKQIKPVKHMVEFKTFDCYDINYDRDASPIIFTRDNHSYLGCRVQSNSFIRFHAYSHGVTPTDVWPAWTSVKNGEATQLAIRANEFANSNGMTSHTWYDVVKEDEELRWAPSSEAHSLYVSVSFVYLSKRRMQQFFTSDMITTFGVIGGLLLLFKGIYELLMFIFTTVWKEEDSYNYAEEQQERIPLSVAPAPIVPHAQHAPVATAHTQVDLEPMPEHSPPVARTVYDEM